MSTIYVYSRRGCHLCEVLIEEMLPLLQGRIDVEVRDIDTDEDWRKAFDVRIPVVEFEGRVICEYHLDKAKIEAIVAAGATPEES
jgi:hypothetical protein